VDEATVAQREGAPALEPPVEDAADNADEDFENATFDDEFEGAMELEGEPSKAADVTSPAGSGDEGMFFESERFPLPA
jgi:hypothetical protein